MLVSYFLTSLIKQFINRWHCRIDLLMTFASFELLINIKIQYDNPTQLQLYDIIYRIIGQNVLYIALDYSLDFPDAY